MYTNSKEPYHFQVYCGTKKIGLKLHHHILASWWCVGFIIVFCSASVRSVLEQQLTAAEASAISVPLIQRTALYSLEASTQKGCYLNLSEVVVEQHR